MHVCSTRAVNFFLAKVRYCRRASGNSWENGGMWAKDTGHICERGMLRFLTLQWSRQIPSREQGSGGVVVSAVPTNASNGAAELRNSKPGDRKALLLCNSVALALFFGFLTNRRKTKKKHLCFVLYFAFCFQMSFWLSWCAILGHGKTYVFPQLNPLRNKCGRTHSLTLLVWSGEWWEESQ